MSWLKNNLTVVGLLVLGIALLVGVVVWASKSEQKPQEQSPQPIGGQTDAHGCLTAAGYSWSVAREECTRSWEEPVMAEAELAVTALLAEKYSKEQDSLSVKVTKIDGTHVAGSIGFEPGEPGGQFLAFKQDGVWQVVYDGNGSVNCSELKDKYGFSALVLSPQFCE